MEATPPTTLVGVSVTDSGAMTRTERFALAVIPARVAVTATVVVAVTAVVVTVNVAVVAPAGMVTEAGTPATALFVDRVAVTGTLTVPLSRSVPVEVFPPPTVVGLRETVRFRIASVAERVMPP